MLLIVFIWRAQLHRHPNDMYKISGWSGVRVPTGVCNFCLHHHVQNGSGDQASYSMGTRGSFPGGKAEGAWNWPLTFI